MIARTMVLILTPILRSQSQLDSLECRMDDDTPKPNEAAADEELIPVLCESLPKY